jgi:HPt (histidine-containing phosphotransfer) domain-containing protein
MREAMQEEFPGLVATYLESAGRLVAELAAAAGAGDAGALYRPAHTLKSSSANLGAMSLSRMAAALESQAKRGSVERPLAQVEAIEAAFARARRALEACLAETVDGSR